jgi:hypothetical protein
MKITELKLNPNNPRIIKEFINKISIIEIFFVSLHIVLSVISHYPIIKKLKSLVYEVCCEMRMD